MRFLVTGGAGFIGSHLVDRLIEDGHGVAVVDDLSRGKREHVHPKARLHKVDIRSPELARVIAEEKPDVVCHQAAQVDVRRSVADPDFDASVNILGSINLLQCAVKHGVQKVIYASSGGAAYGEPEQMPATEACPVRPLCPYGISKHAVEHYLDLYAQLYGLRYTVLRYANVYGPRQDPHGEAGVVAIFSEQMLAGVTPKIFGDGSKTRDYVHVADIVAANVCAIQAGDGEILNVGLGRQVSDYEVFAAVRDALGARVEPEYAPERKGEVHHICLDSTRLRGVGWQPTYTFETGIPNAVEYYKRLHA